MDKVKLSAGQPVFAQLLNLIPQSLVAELSSKHQTDRYCKTFRAKEHIVTMLYAIFHKCTSLTEVITGMQASHSRLHHLGLAHTPRKSTLADANRRTSHEFFQDLFHALQGYFYGDLPDSRFMSKEELDLLILIDSTTVTLFTDIMKGAGSYGLNGKKKGGVKAHVMLDAKHDIPCFVDLTEARVNDKMFLHKIHTLPAGSRVVMDKGYNSYQKLSEWTDKGILWTTRINARAVYKSVELNPVSDESSVLGVRQDHIIELGNPLTVERNAIQRVRMVKYYDAEKEREFTFITNDFSCQPSSVAELYKRRWQIEILFKRIKTNFPLKYFLGDSENAIKIQIWCVLIADLLIKIVQDKVRKQFKRKWAFASIAGLIRIHLSTYIDLLDFLANPVKSLIKYQPRDPTAQMALFPNKGAIF